MRVDDVGFQSRSDRWRSVQEIKNIVVIFFPFDFFLEHYMQMGGKQQNGQLPLPDRTKTSAA